MIRKIVNHSLFQFAILATIILGVLVCVFPGKIPRLSWIVNHAVQIMLFYLFAGIFSLFLKQPRLTFAFFGGCALLCFFLKYSVKGDSIERWRQEMLENNRILTTRQPTTTDPFKLAHINLTNTSSRQEVFAVLRDIDAELISLHEVTPDWEKWLTDSLNSSHQFNHTMIDLGLFGMAIFSKYPLEPVDTFYFNDVPNLKVRINKGEDHAFNLISLHTLPALDDLSKQQLQAHLEMVKKEANSINTPLLITGDFNAVSWSAQLQEFMNQTGLIESRTGFMPGSTSGSISLFDVPLDHILYSGEFICSNFKNIIGETGQRLGILGTYQFVIRNDHVKKEN